MTSRSRLPSAPAHGLVELAAAAQRDLSSDAVIITTGSRTSTVVATAGIAKREWAPLRQVLVALERRLDGTPMLTIPAPPSEDRAETAALDDEQAQLHARGFASAVVVPIKIGQKRLGAIHVLKKRPGVSHNAPLLRALASHAAVTISAGKPMRGRDAKPLRAPLAALGRLLLSAHSFQDLIPALDDALGQIFGPVMTGIMLSDDQDDVLQMVPGSFGADEMTAASYQIRTLNSYSNAARVFVTGDPYLSNHAPGDPAILQDYVEAFGIERLLSVPLITEERSIGVLHVANKPTDFTVRDLSRLQSLTPRLASAVQIARTLFLLRRQQRLEGILSDVAVAIASGQSTQDFLSTAVDELCAAMGAGIVALTPTNSAPIVWRHEDVSPSRERELILRARRAPAVRAEVTGPQKAGDPGWTAFHVPVNLSAQRVGTLSMLRNRAEPFATDERSALVRLANLAALAWATEGYQQQRAELARLDERQRIADDLHDDVAQILFGAQIALDSAMQVTNLPDDVATNVVRARALIVKGDEALRAVIHELSPPMKGDLARELAAAVADVESEFGVPVHLEVLDAAAIAAEGTRRPVRDAMLKVARETLVNAAKHAGPCRVSVRLQLKASGRLQLTVIDDGIGIPEGSPKGHGLVAARRAVRAHGGSLRVHKSATGGTKVIACLPA